MNLNELTFIHASTNDDWKFIGCIMRGYYNHNEWSYALKGANDPHVSCDSPLDGINKVLRAAGVVK